MIKLYDYELSGNCYKVRLLLHCSACPFERIELDFYPEREHKGPWFLSINPLGPAAGHRRRRLRTARRAGNTVYLAALRSDRALVSARGRGALGRSSSGWDSRRA